MARRYLFGFRHIDLGKKVEQEGEGNTKLSAERHARRALKRKGLNPAKYWTTSVKFIGS